MKDKMVKIFDDMGGDTYDKNNAFFYPVSLNLQFLNMLLLKDLPSNARILCVGVGTGVDLIDLAKTNIGWSFVGIDPASSMLRQCEEKLRKENLSDRCTLFNGYLEDYKSEERFDAVLCLYVMHFIKDMTLRANMYADMAKLLKKNGLLIVTEISADFKSENYKFQLENWKALQGHAGAPKEKLENLSKTLEEQLAVLSAEETEKLIMNNGFEKAVPFFQSFMIRGWYARNNNKAN